MKIIQSKFYMRHSVFYLLDKHAFKDQEPDVTNIITIESNKESTKYPKPGIIVN